MQTGAVGTGTPSATAESEDKDDPGGASENSEDEESKTADKSESQEGHKSADQNQDGAELVEDVVEEEATAETQVDVMKTLTGTSQESLHI